MTRHLPSLGRFTPPASAAADDATTSTPNPDAAGVNDRLTAATSDASACDETPDVVPSREDAGNAAWRATWDVPPTTAGRYWWERPPSAYQEHGDGPARVVSSEPDPTFRARPVGFAPSARHRADVPVAGHDFVAEQYVPRHRRSS